jgi:hypothetical protein
LFLALASAGVGTNQGSGLMLSAMPLRCPTSLGHVINSSSTSAFSIACSIRSRSSLSVISSFASPKSGASLQRMHCLESERT